jgi:hypothetical protein
MYLENKKKHCNPGCKCCKPKQKIQRFDDTAEPYIVPLEEHFENFADSVVETAENFLGLGKKAKQKREARQERRSERQEARNEKRISRIKGRQQIREAKAGEIQGQAEENIKQAQIKTASLQAQQQADQTNQLASQLQPTAQPITPSQTPQGSGDSGGLYKTLPEYTPPTDSGLSGMSAGSTGGDFALEQEQPEEAKGTGAKGTEAKVIEEPKKKSNVVLYLVIVAVVIGAYYFMKKK